MRGIEGHLIKARGEAPSPNLYDRKVYRVTVTPLDWTTPPQAAALKIKKSPAPIGARVSVLERSHSARGYGAIAALFAAHRATVSIPCIFSPPCVSLLIR